MKTLIVYTSVHHQNTEKVAKVMAVELEADLIPTGKAQPETLESYDLIGFGSGIYFGKHHKTLLQFVETLPPMKQKRVFVFSPGKAQHIVDRFFLMSKGHNIVYLQGYRPHFNALSEEHDERDQRRRTN
jgi:flavodoxin